MRPLALGWPDDPRAVACEDAFLWGNDLLVAPALHKRRRRVYLPAGDWYDFRTGARLVGRVFPGEGVSWLYEGDGESIDGPSCLTRLEVSGSRVSARREGAFPSAWGA